MGGESNQEPFDGEEKEGEINLATSDGGWGG